MRNKLISVALISTFIVVSAVPVKADSTDPFIVRATCYLPTGNATHSGCYPYEGVIAGKEEWLGAMASLYTVNEDGSIGDWIGYYEFKDTGGAGIQSGKIIDIYRDNEASMYEWISNYGDYVYIQIIRGRG